MDKPAKRENESLVLQELCKDHRNMDKTLQAYEDQLNAYRAGEEVNLSLMYDVMSYLVLNPDQYHHPLEDTFFTLVAKKDIAFKEEVDKTSQEHHLIKAAGEAVLECLSDQIRSPTSLKESQIAAHSEQYINLLRNHMNREEALLFKPGAKLLNQRDWRVLADSLAQNPEDPLFEAENNEHFLSLREYLQERIEETAEKLAQEEYLQLSKVIEKIGILSASAADIQEIVRAHSKEAWQETRDSYTSLINSDDSLLKGLISTPLSCSLKGFDHYVASLSEISGILHKTGESLSDERKSSERTSGRQKATAKAAATKGSGK